MPPVIKTPPAELLRLARQEQADRELNRVWLRKLEAAAAEPGFSGELRRAIVSSGKSPESLAAACGVDVELFEEFQCGEGSLPSAAMDRLIATLHLRLVPAEAN